MSDSPAASLNSTAPLQTFSNFATMSLTQGLPNTAPSTTIAAGDISSNSSNEVLNAFRILTCVIGSIANLVVILAIVMSLEFTKTVTSWYILQLAIADIMFLLTIPLKVMQVRNNQWIQSEGMCKAMETILFINYYASIIFLTVMAVDRYIAICHSFSEKWQKFRSQKAAYIVAIAVWAVCILMCVPVMMYTNVHGIQPTCKCGLQFPVPGTSPEEMCGEQGFTGSGYEICVKGMRKEIENKTLCMDPSQRKIEPITLVPVSGNDGGIINQHCQYVSAPSGFRSFIYFNFIGMFLIPFTIICSCYGLIIYYVIKSAFGGDAGSNANSASSRKRKRVVIMCGTLVIVFFVCWTPYHAQHLAKMYGIRGYSSDFCLNLTHATSMLIFLNSAINPFLYSLITQCRTKMKDVKSTKPGRALASLFTRHTHVDASHSSRSERSSNGATAKELISRRDTTGV